MIIIITRSRIAVMLLYHQQHHPTDQGQIQLQIHVCCSIPVVCVKIFENLFHFTFAQMLTVPRITICLWCAVLNGEERVVCQLTVCDKVFTLTAASNKTAFQFNYHRCLTRTQMARSPRWNELRQISYRTLAMSYILNTQPIRSEKIYAKYSLSLICT